jgi:hypothetical protein
MLSAGVPSASKLPNQQRGRSGRYGRKSKKSDAWRSGAIFVYRRCVRSPEPRPDKLEKLIRDEALN